MQRDPVWDPGNFGNQYSFVGNSPVSGVDPSGAQAPGKDPRDDIRLRKPKEISLPDMVVWYERRKRADAARQEKKNAAALQVLRDPTVSRAVHHAVAQTTGNFVNSTTKQTSRFNEIGGVVFRGKDGALGVVLYDAPDTIMTTTATTLAVPPKGAEVVATFHTHPPAGMYLRTETDEKTGEKSTVETAWGPSLTDKAKAYLHRREGGRFHFVVSEDGVFVLDTSKRMGEEGLTTLLATNLRDVCPAGKARTAPPTIKRDPDDPWKRIPPKTKSTKTRPGR